jgi:hypothetical protein
VNLAELVAQQGVPQREQRSQIISGIGAALDALHRLGRAHGDLRLETISVTAPTTVTLTPACGDSIADDVRAVAEVVYFLFVGSRYAGSAPASKAAREVGVELPEPFDAWFDQASGRAGEIGFAHGAGALRTLRAFLGEPPLAIAPAIEPPRLAGVPVPVHPPRRSDDGN